MSEKMFEFYKEGLYAPQNRISYFGWEGIGIHGFYNYIEGYIQASNVIYNQFICAAEDGDIELQDTIGFPLCFNYRQSIELYLKYYYLKYVQADKEDFTAYLNKVKHDLIKSWEKIKPTLKNLLIQQESSIDFDVIENYIKEWDNFDKVSFKMRYPISKNGQSLHKASVRFDIVNLKENMDIFYNLMEQLDFSIDNQMVKFHLDNTNKEKIDIVYKTITPIISNIISMLSDGVSYKSSEQKYRDFYYNLEKNQQILLGLLFFSAADVISGRCKISKVVSDKKDDFYKVIISNMNEAKLYFDDNKVNLDYVFENIFIKNPNLVLERLKFAQKIMDT